MPLVLAFDQIHTGMLAIVGGKAGNLGEMSRAGLPVPPGFCVTTDAYRLATNDDGLRRILEDIAATAPMDTTALIALAARARAAILAMKMPPEIATAVSDAYRGLGAAQPVAVRSSATAEDLPMASFAGQQDTYLNIVGTDAVLDAVHRCWASLWTDRAVSYRATNAIDPRSVQLAVVVQRMVDAAVAGVMFTANPVTGKRSETVIDASPGLGEAVVSGAVNPDHFVVNTSTGDIVERRLGDKRLVIRSTAGGGTTHVTRDAADDSYCISDDQVRALVKLGARVAAHYKSPQDTEWAIDNNGQLWLTQARPVTTLFPLPGARGEGPRVYFCFSLAQGLHRPLTPMGLAILPVIGTSVARTYGLSVPDPLVGPSGVAQAASRFFFDITTLMQHPVGREMFPRMLDVMEARSAVVLRHLRDDPRFPSSRSKWPFLRRVVLLALRFKVPVVVARALISPPATRRRLAELGSDLVRRATPPTGLTSAERLEFVITMLGETVIPVMPQVMPAAITGFAMLGLASKLLGDDASSDDLQNVLRSLPHNVTTEMDLALWQVATVIRRNASEADLIRTTPAQELAAQYTAGTLPSRVQNELSAFLDKYGHRAVAEIDIGVPRWSEDPAHILGVLANYLRLDDPSRAPDAMFATGAADAEKLVATLTDRARRRGRLRGTIVGFALERARQLTGVRELPKYYLIVVLTMLRRELARIGAELSARGVIAAPDDVFFLTLRETQMAIGGENMRDVVRQRREEYAHEMRRKHVPRVLLSDGTEPEAQLTTARKGDGALTGTPASAGSVTGKARVIMDPVGAHLEPGEILVAPSTDPGWTPLFLTAGGLVMEMGGANSHGAVVAREYGIPAVVGVDGATSRLATGQTITVDGTNGVITVASVGAVSLHHAKVTTTS